MAQAIAATVFWFAGGILVGIYATIWLLSSDRPSDREDKDTWRF